MGGNVRINPLIPVLAGAACLFSACAMFTSWRDIPPPGGCDECHKVPISANWQLAYKPAVLSDERGGESFQTPESLMTGSDKPATPLERRKLEELACFECHREPNAAHKTFKGTFHH